MKQKIASRRLQYFFTPRVNLSAALIARVRRNTSDGGKKNQLHVGAHRANQFGLLVVNKLATAAAAITKQPKRAF